MSRLNKYLNRSSCEYPDDVKAIKDTIPAWEELPDSLVEKMWSDYSETLAAGWLTVSDEEIKHFKRWLE